MIRKMGGDKREWSYPIVDKNNQVAVTDRGKADLLAITFVDIHSGRNLSEESK